MANEAAERIPIRFINDGPFPITIGTEVVQPGGSVQHIFMRGELPARWTATEIHVALTAPEEPLISRRSPMGIIEHHDAKARRAREPDVKFVQTRPHEKAEDAGARLLQIATEIGPNAKGWYYVEKINAQFLYKDGGSPAEYGAGIACLRAEGRILMHDSGTSRC
jgi:hypothetical protein